MGAPQGAIAVVFAVAVVLAPPLVSAGTSPLPFATSLRDLPREIPDDPPVSPESLSRRPTSPARVVSYGPYVSVQVNVNGAGDNIVGDAANEPTIAIDPGDPTRITIGWRQFDSIASNFRQAGVAYSDNVGQSWTSSVIDPGAFRSDPVLAVDGTGGFYYSSLTCPDFVNNPSCDDVTFHVFKSIDGGVTWPSFAYAFGGDKQWIAVDDRPSGLGAGHIYQVWNVQTTCCPPNDFTWSVNGGASFGGPIAMPAPSLKWGTLAIDSGGTLYAAGANLTVTGHAFARSTSAKNPAVTPAFDIAQDIDLGGRTVALAGIDSPNPVGLMGQVWVAADPSVSNRVYVLGSVEPFSGGDPLDVHFIRSDDGGMTWSVPVAVNDNPGDGTWQWFATMSVAPNGRIDVIWNDTRGDPESVRLSQVRYSYSTDGGFGWSDDIPVSPIFDSHLGFPGQSKIGDYYHMISDNDWASLAYSATFNGEEDIYFLRIPGGRAPTVPTLSKIGAAAMTALLLAAGTILISRRKHASGRATRMSAVSTTCGAVRALRRNS